MSQPLTDPPARKTFDPILPACYRLSMSTAANRVRRETRRTSSRPSRVGVDLLEAKKDLSSPRPRSARLIESVLREAGSAEGPADLSSNLRGHLDQR